MVIREPKIREVCGSEKFGINKGLKVGSGCGCRHRASRGRNSTRLKKRKILFMKMDIMIDVNTIRGQVKTTIV